MNRGRTGTSTIEYSPKKIKQIAKAKKKTEARWTARSGGVITRKIGDPKVDPPPGK